MRRIFSTGGRRRKIFFVLHSTHSRFPLSPLSQSEKARLERGEKGRKPRGGERGPEEMGENDGRRKEERGTGLTTLRETYSMANFFVRAEGETISV